jgi:hypothetical protein
MFDHYGEQDAVTSQLVEKMVVGFDLVVDTRWGFGTPVSDSFGTLSENRISGKHKDSRNIARYVLVDQLDAYSMNPLKADCNRDTVVNATDLAIMARQWLSEP